MGRLTFDISEAYSTVSKPVRASGANKLRMQALLLDVPLQCTRSDLSAVDVALPIGGNTFNGTRSGGFLHGIRNEIVDRAIFRASDADAALPAIVIARNRFRLGVRRVQDIILVDVKPAWSAELFPFR